MRHRHLGFTLTELMIVVAVVAVLTMVAYPTYMDSFRKARRADAINALENLHLAQEQFRAYCASYATSLGGGNLCDAGTPTYRVDVAATSAEGYYAIAILSGANGTGFVATADPSGTDQASDTCGVFAINQDGPVTSNPSYANSRCWGI